MSHYIEERLEGCPPGTDDWRVLNTRCYLVGSDLTPSEARHARECQVELGKFQHYWPRMYWRFADWRMRRRRIPR